MKNSVIKYSLRSILVALALCFLGVVIIIKADTVLFWIIKIIGAVLLIDSAIRFISFFRLDPEERSFSVDIVRAVVEAVMGIVAVVNSSSVVTLLYVFAGVIVVIEGILHLQFVLTSRRVLTHWLPNMLIAIVSVIIGVFIILNPLMTGKFVNIFIGVEILVTALISLGGYIILIFFRPSKNEIELDEDYVEEIE